MATSSIFADSSWLTDLLNTPENQTLTKALQHSFATSSRSDQENFQTNKRVGTVPPPTKKLAKKKSRASKKTHTTYITADPSNFRQMVQQVTGGVPFNGGTSHMGQGQGQQSVVMKPEPQRQRFPAFCLPTLDTSAFLLDHVGPSTGVMPVVNGGGGAAAAVMEFDGFPTLESSFPRVVESGFVTF